MEEGVRREEVSLFSVQISIVLFCQFIYVNLRAKFYLLRTDVVFCSVNNILYSCGVFIFGYLDSRMLFCMGTRDILL